MNVVFMGSKRQGLVALETIAAFTPACVSKVITFDDSKDLRSVLPQFVAFAGRTGIPLVIAADAEAAEKELLAANAGLALLVCWYWMLGPEVLKAVPKILCLHNSLLPEYRGAAPLVWALINGERRVGISLFRVRSGMDDGEVYAQAPIPVGPWDAIKDVLERVEAETEALLDLSWPMIYEEKLIPKAQDDSRATYGLWRSSRDGEIDWAWPAYRVYDFIRAQSAPYPGAFTWDTGDLSLIRDKIIIQKATLSDIVYYSKPGSVVDSFGEDGCLVSCGDGRCVRLDAVKLKRGTRLGAKP